MKKIVLMAAALVMGASAMAQQAFPSYISITGKAEREVVPDEIFVRITIDENTSRGRVTVADQERNMIAALRNLGIDVEKDLQVSDLAGDLQTFLLRRNRTLTTKTYELKVKDASTLSKVFSALADINISNATVTKATRSDIDDIRNELRAEAILNAQASARALAEALGQSIGKAFMISEYAQGNPVYYAESADMAVMVRGVAKNASDATLDFKNLNVTHTVSAQFVLE